MITPEYLLFRF